MGLFGNNDNFDESPEAAAHRRALTKSLTFELIPLKSLADAVDALPEHAEVSVTCSPTKGIEETQRLTEELLSKGYQAIPHIAARMVRDQAHTVELADWCRDLGLTKAFIVGGDAPEPGDYLGAVEFLADFAPANHGLDTIGVTAYPDGHAFLSNDVLHRALHDKQRILADAGVNGYCSTQMCFNPDAIAKWLWTEREAGLTLPVHLGISGVVDKAKLLKMGARLGIGDSLKYLRKNVGAVVKMMTTVSYDPNDLLLPLSGEMLDRGVEGLHVFTFNQVDATNRWRQAVVQGG
jgi:methylenetetrahydrofolate reductase (NADPH)